MNLSQRLSRVASSATIAITSRAAELKQQGIDVVSFSAGEPDFDTPKFIKDAAKAALDAGDTKYMPRTLGKLKDAISEKLARENGLDIPAGQIQMTFGGKHACYACCQALVDPGQKVLIPAPYWVSYTEMVKLADGEPVILETSPASGFKITPEQILAHRDARAIFINSPSNPTGVTYSPDELKALADAILQTDMIVFSDEIYEKLIYGETEFVSFASLDKRLPERTITLNGLSKSFSMTGWRLGWAAGPADAIGAIRKLMSHETTNPVSFAIAGALAAYTSPQADGEVEKMRGEFERRGEHMYQRLAALPGVTCEKPTGAFYCFPDVSSHYGRTLAGVEVTDSLSFARAALEGQVALVPGSAFGEDRCVRLTFATDLASIDKGIDRLAELLK
jgi:aspartate aminotransferase